MKIAVTDGFTLNNGDLNWNVLDQFGELQVYDRTPVDLIIQRCADADIILTNKVPFNKSTIEQLEKTKLICVLATGYNVIDVSAAKEKGIFVCNVPTYGTASVAQHTFALILELCNKVGVHHQSVSNGEWVNSQDWCYTKGPLIELADKTLGIVGFGHIGQQTALIGKAFGMKIVYNSRTEKQTEFGTYADLNTLFKVSDVISLHCPLTNDNREFVNRELLTLAKRNAVIINASRGPLINEADLAAALNNNKIAGAALDVLSTEPPKADNPLLKAKNCIITPHIAWMSFEARQRILSTTVQNIKAFINQSPINVVSK